ncbi:MAG: hypothetical protein GY945_14760 [Rhodobacteraceae bacterium]|nr:hypothetical protein [Paracoccaceae bacterium]
MARGVVVRARFIGKENLVEFSMEDGTHLQVSMPSVFLPATGTALWVASMRDRCFVFAQGGSRVPN